RQRLPRSAEVRLTLDKSLRGREGPLDAGKSKTYSFRTFGPLEVVSLSCGFSRSGDTSCPANSELIEVVLSNPVEESQAQAAVEVEPAVPLTVRADEREHGAQTIYIHGPFAPSTTYKIRVKKGLTDVFNETLAADWKGSFEIGPSAPVALLGLEGSIFEPSARSDIPIISVNAPELRMATAPVDERSVLELFNDNGEHRTGLLSDLKPATIARLAGGKSFALKPAAALNAPATSLLSVGPLLDAKTQRGAFAIGLEYTPGARADAVVQSAVVQVTDLAITAKASRQGSLVRVTRISTGEPVAGSRVTVQRPGAAGSPDVFTTDAEGFASIPPSKFTVEEYLHGERAVFFARSGDEWAFRPVNAASSFGDVYTYLDEPPTFGVMFTERRIYRPGEVAQIKGILRREARAGTDKRARTPAGEAVEVSVRSYPDNEIVKRTVTTTPFGTFWLEAKIPESAKLGYYRIEAKIGDEPVHAEATFEVAEYRPNELAVSVTSDRPSYLRGDKATFTIQGDLLSGTPAAGVEGRVLVYRSPATFSPPGLPEGFQTGDEAYAAERDQVGYRHLLQSTKVKLDVRGSVVIPVGLAPPEQVGPETISCEAEIGERGGQAVAARAKVLLHPAEIYLGLDPGVRLFARAKTPFQPRVAVVDTNGAPSAAKVPVRLELIDR
ncbi:MAG TPA: MG2 domain-containing protein, partial [Polyangiaceae bacterium]|nr:MG2 domain-containing protein [Polyangiaceae bacterium]